MAIRQAQHLKLAQKMLPQQILLMKLLQLPTTALEERIKEEMEVNPALEEDDQATPADEDLYSNKNSPDAEETEPDENGDISEPELKSTSGDVEMEDYMDAEELDSYKYEVVNKGVDDDTREFNYSGGAGFAELLEEQ